MKSKDNPPHLPLQGRIVEEAGRKAVRDAKLFHKRMGYPMVVWKDGKVVEIPPEDIVIEDE